MPVIYRYTLTSPDSSITFGTECVKNWNDLKPGLTRHETLRGITSEFSGTFIFVDDAISGIYARTFVRDVEDKYGIDADLTLKIEIGNESGWQSSFEQSGTILKANFAKTFAITETECQLAFSPSDFQTMVVNRWDTNVSHDQLTSIDGGSFTGDIDQRKDVSLHVRVLDETTKYTECEHGDIFQAGNLLVIPFKTEYFGSEYFQTQQEYHAGLVIGDTLPTAFAFHKNADVDTQIYFKYNVNINVSGYYDLGSGQTDAPDTFYLSILVLEDGYIPSSPNMINILTLAANTSTSKTLSANGETEFLLPKGFSAFFVARIAREGTSVNRFMRINSNDLTITANSKLIDYPTLVKLNLIHEAIERNLQIVTGQQKCIYAPIFGRKDLGYESDGEYSFLAVGSGYNLRNFPYTNDEKKQPLTTNLKELIGSLISIYNVVCYFKLIDNEIRLCIEKYSDVWGLTLDDSDMVELTDISEVQKTFNEKLHYSQILVGYKNQEYEEINGVLPYNSHFEFAAPLKSVNNKFDEVSIYRTDDYGIEYKRRKQYVNFPTTDTKGDTDKWFIRLIPPVGNVYTCERNESFETVTGVYDPQSAYNLNLSPARNLKRWWPVLNTGLYKKSGGKIKYMVAEKNSSLATKKTGEPLLTEAADILISDLTAPIIMPYQFVFNAVLSNDQWNHIVTYPNYPIKFSVINNDNFIPLYGIIDDLTYNQDTGLANVKLTQINR